MGLCLHVFDQDFDEDDEEDPDELAECDLGPYENFRCFRETVARELDAADYPILMEHDESDGEWTVTEIPTLETELRAIAARFQLLPPAKPGELFELDPEYREGAESLYDCFHDTSGENLFEALLELCQVAQENKRPITFM